MVLPGEGRVDTVSSGIAIQPEDWRRGCLAQDSHLGNDPPREDLNSDSVPDGRQGGGSFCLKRCPLFSFPHLSQLPGALGLKLSWGSSRTRSQQTLQPTVSVLICFSCYFFHSGKGLDSEPWWGRGRHSQEGLSPGAGRKTHFSLHVGKSSRGCKFWGAHRVGHVQ